MFFGNIPLEFLDQTELFLLQSTDLFSQHLDRGARNTLAKEKNRQILSEAPQAGVSSPRELEAGRSFVAHQVKWKAGFSLFEVVFTHSIPKFFEKHFWF